MKKETKWGALCIVVTIMLTAGACGEANGPLRITEESIPSTQEIQTDSAFRDTAHSHADMGNTAQDMADAGEGKTEQNLSGYIRSQDEIMMDMMEKMEDITRTGSASLDFINGMIPHHEAAVAMAAGFLEYGGENRELRKLAEDIISLQKSEIEEMKELAEELKEETKTDEQQEKAYLEEYFEMFADPHAHHLDLNGAGSVDEAFAAGMLMHHVMAVDMARTILDYTNSERLREMAEKMIDVQEKEIDQMQTLLEKVTVSNP